MENQDRTILNALGDDKIFEYLFEKSQIDEKFIIQCISFMFSGVYKLKSTYQNLFMNSSTTVLLLANIIRENKSKIKLTQEEEILVDNILKDINEDVITSIKNSLVQNTEVANG